MTQPAGEGAPSGAETGTPSGAGPAGEPPVTEGAPSGVPGEGTETPTPETVSKEDFEKLKKHLSAADAKRAAAETELQKIRDKDLPEVDKLKRDYVAATERVAKLETDLRDARVLIAFLKDNTHAWKDVTAAMALVDLGQVTIAEDGTVVGLKEALKGLAVKYPFMLEDKPKGDGTGTGTGTSKPGGSSVPPMNGTAGSNKPAGLADLSKRLPAMRARRSQ